MSNRTGLSMLLAGVIAVFLSVGVPAFRITQHSSELQLMNRFAGSAEAVETPTLTEQPAKAEKNPPGDIPDTQAFITYQSKVGKYAIDVPEGWARTEKGPDATFKDKYNGEQISLTKSAYAPTETSVRKDQVPATEKAGRAAKVLKVKSVRLGNKQSAICVVYTANSEPNPVTGKQLRLDMATYYYYRNGTLAALTLWAPTGADNADQWKRISESFRWM